MPYPHHLHEGTPYRDCPVCRNIIATRRPVQLIEIILMKEEFYHDIDAETYQVQKMRTSEKGSPASALPLSTDSTSRLRSKYNIVSETTASFLNSRPHQSANCQRAVFVISCLIIT